MFCPDWFLSWPCHVAGSFQQVLQGDWTFAKGPGKDVRFCQGLHASNWETKTWGKGDDMGMWKFYFWKWHGDTFSMVFEIPSGYLTVCHGKSPFVIGKPSINGLFSMAMLNNQRVVTRGVWWDLSIQHQGILGWEQWRFTVIKPTTCFWVWTWGMAPFFVALKNDNLANHDLPVDLRVGKFPSNP